MHALPKVKLSLKEVVELAFAIMPWKDGKPGKPIGFVGKPGVGKSSIGMSLAKIFTERTGIQHHCKIFNASQHEPTDVCGLPYVTEDKRTEYALAGVWPTEPNTIMVIEEPTKGTSKLIQNALGEAMREFRVGSTKFPENTMFFLSWNGRGDGAGDDKVLSHFINRMCVIEHALNPDDQYSYSIAHGWNPYVLAYLKQFPQKWFEDEVFLKNGKYDSENPCFPSPRSWEGVSELMDKEQLSLKLKMAGTQGFIGQGPAQEFFAWYEVSKTMPDINMCIEHPTTAPVPDEASIIYAITVALSIKSNEKNIKNVIDYVKRLRRDFQVLWAKSIADRNPELLVATPEVRKWIVTVSDIIQ